MSTKTLLTTEDLWKIVADGSRYELSRGEVMPMTPVARKAVDPRIKPRERALRRSRERSWRSIHIQDTARRSPNTTSSRDAAKGGTVRHNFVGNFSRARRVLFNDGVNRVVYGAQPPKPNRGA